MFWAIAVLVLLVTAGILIRRRYGNLYTAATVAIERRTGIHRDWLWRGLALATVAIWLIVYFAIAGDRHGGLQQLMEGLYAPSSQKQGKD